MSNDVINACKGSQIDLQYCKYLIEKASINNDTIDVQPNSTIRFLQNPYYKQNIGEDIRKMKTELQNSYLGQKRKEDNYKKLYNAIVDHDCFLGKLKYKHIRDITGLSITTIKNYLNDYPILKDVFDEVSLLSRTTK